MPLVIDGKTEPAGEYTMFVDLKPNDWTFIVSRRAASPTFPSTKDALFGANDYRRDKDVVRTPMKIETLPSSVDSSRGASPTCRKPAAGSCSRGTKYGIGAVHGRKWTQGAPTVTLRRHRADVTHLRSHAAAAGASACVSGRAARAGGCRQRHRRSATENRLYFADYRDVDGMKWPFRLRRALGADTVEETTFDRFRVNAKIDAKKFQP